jgi:hypothetical protein
VSRDPERRYQSVEHVVVALTPLGTLGAFFRGRTSGACTDQIAPEADKPSLDALPERRGSTSDVRSNARSSWFAIAGGALLVISLVAGLRLLRPFAEPGDSTSNAAADLSALPQR